MVVELLSHFSAPVFGRKRSLGVSVLLVLVMTVGALG